MQNKASRQKATLLRSNILCFSMFLLAIPVPLDKVRYNIDWITAPVYKKHAPLLHTHTMLNDICILDSIASHSLAVKTDTLLYSLLLFFSSGLMHELSKTRPDLICTFSCIADAAVHAPLEYGALQI